MDVMSLRRAIIGGLTMGTSWKYTKYVYNVTQEESFDTFASYFDKYIAPLVSGLSKWFSFSNFINNGNSARSAIVNMCFLDPALSGMRLEMGKRVGGYFETSYGANIHAGSTIEIYVSEDMPSIGVSSN